QMQMCVSQNNNNEELWTGKRRPKRDFHFQVIPLPQHQQYFVWPTKHDENSNKRKQMASSSSSSSAYSSVPTTFSSIPSTSSSGPETPKATVTPTIANGVRRGRFAVQTTKVASPSVSIPSNRLSDEHTVSCSAPSDTFKILSISKNVSFDNETDGEEEELMCSEVVISRRLSSAPPPSNR
ncbi:hypothetical protein PENTCL1PPCAC_7298, partial [Pristionchus entomophagus]